MLFKACLLVLLVFVFSGDVSGKCWQNIFGNPKNLRKTWQEEFTRYVYDCDVVHTLRSAIVRLYELPIKANNIEKFFAEYIENNPRDLKQLSMLRAELSYQIYQAQDLMKTLEKLDNEILSVEQFNVLGQKLNKEQLNKDEHKTHKVMKRFFKDLQEFPPGMFSATDSIIFKKDEKKSGGESEGGKKSRQFTVAEESSDKQDSQMQFIEDIKKLDPWGTVFPRSQQQRQTDKIHVPNSSTLDLVLTDNTQSTVKKTESRQNSKIVRHRSLQNVQNTNKQKFSNEKSRHDFDDSKSLAELYHHQQRHEKRIDYSHIMDEAIEEGEEPTLQHTHQCIGECALQWDVDYWKQFFKTGAYIFDNPLEDKLALLKQWCKEVGNGGPEFEVEYLNPHVTDSVHFNEKKITDEPPAIKESPASHQYHLDNNIWTAKFVHGQIPIQLFRGGDLSSKSIQSTISRKKSLTRTYSKSNSRMRLDEPDIVDDNFMLTARDDQLLHCGETVRTYSKAVSQHKESSKPRSDFRKLPRPIASAIISQMIIGKKLTKSKSLSKRVKLGKTQETSARPVSSKGSSRPATDYIKDSLESDHENEEASFNGSEKNHETQKLSKIAQGKIVVPNYEGDGPKQIPFPRNYQSESDNERVQKESHVQKSFSKNGGHLVLPAVESNKRNRDDSDHSQDTKSVIGELKGQSIRQNQFLTTDDSSHLQELHHPYPELLIVPKHKPNDKHSKDNTKLVKNGERFLRFVNQHYDKDAISQLEQDYYDFSVFEGML